MFEFIGIEQSCIQNIQLIKVYSMLTDLSGHIISINLLDQSDISVCSGQASASLILLWSAQGIQASKFIPLHSKDLIKFYM
jgi:hypothetical protein